jgi:hypothetical protein
MLTLGQAARLGTIPATGPAVRHATTDVTDATHIDGPTTASKAEFSSME